MSVSTSKKKLHVGRQGDKTVQIIDESLNLLKYRKWVAIHINDSLYRINGRLVREG